MAGNEQYRVNRERLIGISEHENVVFLAEDLLSRQAGCEECGLGIGRKSHDILFYR